MAYRIGWFSTGRDEAAIDLFETVSRAIDGGQLNARIAFCFMNRVSGEAPESDRFRDAVTRRGIPIESLSSRDFQPELWAKGKQDAILRRQWREAYHSQVGELVACYDFDLIVLAGYMLVVGANMCRRFTMINLHPALPGGPVGTWQDVIRQLLATGADRTGAMIHLVTADLDQGPPISYFSFPIEGAGFDEIRERGAARELPLILMTLKCFAEGDLSVADGRVLYRGEELRQGCELTDQVERWLGQHKE